MFLHSLVITSLSLPLQPGPIHYPFYMQTVLHLSLIVTHFCEQWNSISFD